MKIKQIENITLEWVVQNSFRDDLYIVDLLKMAVEAQDNLNIL